MRDTMARELQEVVDGLLSRKGVHHAILGIANGDRSFQWIGAAGNAKPGGAPMKPETPFFIASIDKLFTATIILKLRERGKIGLDEPISSYLPHSLIGGLHRLDAVDYTGALNIRHLLSHTSGLPDWLEDRPKGGQSLVERLIEKGDFSLSIDDVTDIVRNELTPYFPPQPFTARRQKARYSDTNYLLLANIIEAVTGQPLHAVHEELLWRPLKLQHTWIAGHSDPLEPALEPASLWVNGKPLEIPLMMRSIWGVYSTVADTLRFLNALVQGKVFDDPATGALMQKRWNRFGFPLDRAALRLPSWPIEYGLGLMRFHDPLLKLLARVPSALLPLYPVPAVIGHTGSTGCWLFYCPQLDLLLSGTVDQVTAGALPFRLLPKVVGIVHYHRRVRMGNIQAPKEHRE